MIETKFPGTVQYSMTGERGAWLTRGSWMDTPGAEEPEIILRFHSVSTKWDVGESLTYRSQINHIIIISDLLTLSNTSHA